MTRLEVGVFVYLDYREKLEDLAACSYLKAVCWPLCTAQKQSPGRHSPPVITSGITYG